MSNAPREFYQSYSNADIDFMTGMIPHHAQAVIMAGWAPSHGARSDLAILCERIVVGQADEIRSMQTWLSDRGQPVPDAKSTRMKMKMNGVEHDMLMPGMLTRRGDGRTGQGARAANSTGCSCFGMIKHHQGAIDMVNDLFKAYGAAQDDTIYKFASDVFADQTDRDRSHEQDARRSVEINRLDVVVSRMNAIEPPHSVFKDSRRPGMMGSDSVSRKRREHDNEFAGSDRLHNGESAPAPRARSAEHVAAPRRGTPPPPRHRRRPSCRRR